MIIKIMPTREQGMSLYRVKIIDKWFNAGLKVALDYSYSEEQGRTRQIQQAQNHQLELA